jgi:hypothetical protein
MFDVYTLPLGTAYSYDDTSGDTGLYHFNISVAPSYVFSTIRVSFCYFRVHV